MTKAPVNDDFKNAIDAVIPATAPNAKTSNADTASTLRNLAAFHLTYGQIANAERLLKIALWINPEDGQSQRLQVHVLARRGAAMDAARLLVNVSKARSADIKLSDWKEVGLALLRSGHNALGVKLLSKKSA